ncbi:Unsaturated rhamnogalacturonyl hydrolase [Purpureocillium takamizusanense]|uniref:Unsaturated rhamnogalacturonyl hydrolase n=1 Tax=Purpureocillium takamizusanense TaxID=2060973 RepID=A0A9Q8VEB8_9HYPO|nr:Unsaturated rhamnogalacturonyl hydrolase [Purpureocillium takamizusanense]UNI22131.1 Unsaturated rhamnogalacturonyl hydrolase [Purpureocillium takamizusanense]
MFAAIVAALAAALAMAPVAARGCGHQPYSRRMLDSIKLRQQGVISSGAASSTLENGILALAMHETLAQYPDAPSRDDDGRYLVGVLDSASRPYTNATWAATRPLDRFSLATGIERAVSSGLPVTPASTTAYEAINASLALQRRNPDSGLWYFVYTEWSYLDGMVSLLPFMAGAAHPNETDMRLQVQLLEDHCRRPDGGPPLLVHGYDWSRKAVWANNMTGASPYVWGRSLGWFLAGMVQTYERYDCGAGSSSSDKPYRPLCSQVRNVTVQIVDALVDLADGETGAWWQLPTFPRRAGNYLESSSTVLFIFSILKGLRLGLVSDGPKGLQKAALRAYEYTTRAFVTDVGKGNGTIGFDKTVAVCSLNSTATYEYYTSRPILPDSLLGESTFILAALEVERLNGHKRWQ